MYRRYCIGPLTEVALSTIVKKKPAWQGLILGAGVKYIFIRKMIKVRMNNPYIDGNSLIMALKVLKIKSVLLSREGTT